MGSSIRNERRAPRPPTMQLLYHERHRPTKADAREGLIYGALSFCGFPASTNCDAVYGANEGPSDVAGPPETLAAGDEGLY